MISDKEAAELDKQEIKELKKDNKILAAEIGMLHEKV